MKRFGFRELMLVATILAIGGMFATVKASDKGPQFVPATLPLGAGTVTPVGQVGAFVPQYIVFTAPAGETQTVSLVVGSVTNTVGTKVIAAGDYVMVITNVPPMFVGDKFKIASSVVTGTNSCKVIGNLYD